MFDKLRSLVSHRPYQPWSAAKSFDRLLQGADPWVAIGDFLDDWRSASIIERPALIAAPIKPSGEQVEYQRWAAFFAAMVEYLCLEEGLPVPQWVTRQAYILSAPWYLYRGKRPEWLAWQEE